MKFRKKPVVIEAEQWFKPGDHPAVFPQAVVQDHACTSPRKMHGQVQTLEGNHLCVCPGDWIICGVKGEYYPCKPDIFEATYECVDESGEKCPYGCVEGVCRVEIEPMPGEHNGGILEDACPIHAQPKSGEGKPS